MRMILKWSTPPRWRRLALCVVGCGLLAAAPRALAQASPEAAKASPQPASAADDQAEPAKTEPDPQAKEKATPAKRENDKAKPRPRRPVRTRATRGARGAARARGRQLTPDENAKWSCDTLHATAEPIWRSSGKSVDFVFNIKNEGTADLHIRAKGG